MRPTQERIREAVFSSLGAKMHGARVLDLFAGAGGYGLEAWSRGAREITAVDYSAAHIRLLEKNIRALQGDPRLGLFRAIRADAYLWLPTCRETADLIFADPPYAEADLPRLLQAVNGCLAADGILIFEMGISTPRTLPANWILLKEKTYGDTRILFLHHDPFSSSPAQGGQTEKTGDCSMHVES